MDIFFCSGSICVRTFRSNSVPSASRADGFLWQTARLSGLAFSIIACGIHGVRRRIKFGATRHSSYPRVDLLWSLALRARTILFAFISQADIFCLMSGSFFITRGPLPTARADLHLLRGPLPLVPDHFNSRGSRWIFSGHFRFACKPFSQQADLFCCRPCPSYLS